MEVKKEITWGGRTLSISTGKFAKQATGSVMVTYGDTTVLCTVVAAKKPGEDQGFFPLTVNYIEKAYAVGKIPGGFNKREGKPSDRETLISRLIDRPIRPLFHPDFRNETQIVCTVLSYDKNCGADIASIIGASAALMISGIPFLAPVAAVRLGYSDGKFILNPSAEASDELSTNLDLVVAGTKEGILMVESEANELSEEEMLSALKFGYKAFQPVIEMIEQLAAEVGKEKWPIAAMHPYKKWLEDYFNSEDLQDKIIAAYSNKEKMVRYPAIEAVLEEAAEDIHSQKEDVPDWLINEVYHETCSNYVRREILDRDSRIDGRTSIDIRPISCEVSLLPKVHGSSLFCRGETQAMGICTLGSSEDQQLVDSLVGEYNERFSLHYNFPPFSVGEIGRLGAPGRREIGHGKLAWRAIHPVLPSYDEFPYTIRIVSEVMSCNGSSSMATVCDASMALMDAGVPIKKPVAGIAMGLIYDESRSVILSDIMGDEDHLGDMDFKVTGTEDGITALQMDIKITSITFDIMEKALHQAKDGRKFILSKMAEAISESRKELNPNAPRIKVIYIDKDKIRDVIGPGGKVIKEIIENTGVKIDIEDSGKVSIFSPDLSALNNALEKINFIAGDPVVGDIYDGKVVKITDFGAFVNFFGRDGLVHISEFDDKRVERVSDYVSEGDTIKVKFLGYDRGKAKLSVKAVKISEDSAKKKKCKKS